MQTVGLICLVLFILLRMHYMTIGYIWGVFCLIPFVIGVVSLISKSVSYRKYSSLNLAERPAPYANRREDAVR